MHFNRSQRDVTTASAKSPRGPILDLGQIKCRFELPVNSPSGAALTPQAGGETTRALSPVLLYKGNL